MKARNIPHQPKWGGHVSTAAYALGYTLSLALTLIAFLMVGKKVFSGRMLGAVLLLLAIVQTAIQLRYFLNFGLEDKPRWNFWTFFFMLALLLIIVIGTLVIMASLNYRMML